jgi:type VI protein secretion system component Hcp
LEENTVSIDLLMKFVKGSDAIDAECQTTVDSKDDLLHDFKTGKFFEVDEFNFGVGLEDDDSAGEKPKEKYGEKLKPAVGAHASRTRFTNWLRGEQKEYPVDLEPFTFSRQMDQASPLLFEMCCNSQSFASATLIKRKAAGTDASGRAFLRIDFKDVLVIGVDWDSGDVVKEKCKFICRGVKVQYKPQMPDGTLGAAVPGEWHRMMPKKGG